MQQKVYLSMGGILGVMMGIVVSYGLCSVLGFFYSAAHAVMPFLLLGIGIDDMFVIVQCLNTLTGQLAGHMTQCSSLIGRMRSVLVV